MKKSVIKFSSVIFVCFLILAAGSMIFIPSEIAAADSTVEVIEAAVSNLESNATAGKSALKIVSPTNDKAIYIPESYFLQYEGIYAGDIHKVTYAGETFYYQGEPTLKQITVADDELLSPDVTLKLKEGADVKIGIFQLTDEYTIKFLGFNETGTEIYVSAIRDGNSPILNFIPADCVETFTIPYQRKAQIARDELLASKEDPPVIDGGNFTSNTSVGLRIVIIIGIAIPAILIVILLFKPSKNERRYSKNSVRSGRGRDDFDYDDSRSYRRRERDERDEREYDRRDDRDYRSDRRDDRDYDRRYDDRDYR